jgi:hypothetical protein
MANSPLHIAVDRRRRLVEGDGANRRRRVAADAGQRQQARLILGEAAAMAAGHGAGASMKIAGTGVIAQAGPGREHVVERGFGQRLDGGPAFDKAAEIVADRGHGGLLQHDLRQPDDVGIGAFSGRRAPRQGATMSIVPGKQT